MSVYKYVNWQGKVIDLSDWISPEMPKEAVAQIARQKGRTHALKRAIQSLRNAGYRPDEIQQMTQWILSGRTLAGIGG